MADIKIIPYRDSKGYIIVKYKPVWSHDAIKKSGGYKSASLIWCPERETLRWIGHCENCELFAGHKQHYGVQCRTDKPINSGKYYRGTRDDNPIK